ncbi:protein unc-45 homolog B-like isoform X1 [Temnothorax americanus]|uniref:protein unc-45 homolog B-like isoform X1 n=1 Tax=Temnothorax americanus TaxID=1964332 RepID=UPI004067EA79
MAESNMTAQEWKEKGNEEFNKGNWSEALSDYTNALNLVDNNAEKTVYYKNRAAALLKQGIYEEVIKDCNNALKICCNKALYRRCQALEALERFEEAHRDAEIIISSDPNNEVIQPVSTRLLEIVRRKENPHLIISSDKLSQMLDLAFNVSADKKKRETVMTNLLVFARDEAVAEEIFQKEGVSKIVQLVKVEENEKVSCSAIRIVGELCKNNINRTEYIVQYAGLFWCLDIMNSTSTEKINASQYCLQTILNTYSGMNDEPDSKPNETLCMMHKKKIDTILSCLLNASRTITSGLARDTLIEFITRNIYYTALNWAERLVDFRGLQKLMEMASEMVEFKKNYSIDITSSTQIVISMCLAKVYENMYSDVAKKKFNNAIDEFIEDKLSKSDTESKVRIVLAITTLIFGPLDVAEAVISKPEIFETIFAMSKTDDILQQKVICECIVAVVTKSKKVSVFIRQSVNILENLYQSENDSIRIRALVGFCKLSKFDKSILSDCTTIEPFTDGATKKLAKVCIRVLINHKKRRDIRKWAVEGLSYLISHVEVKEELIKDRQAVKAMIELAETNDQSVIFGLTIILVNLCDAYDKKEFIPEMTELVMFIRHYFSEEYLTKDGNDFVKKRRCVLATEGVTSALVNLAKTDSWNCKELIARVFKAICSQHNLRKIVVDEGGTEALLSLSLNGTDKGKKYASRALVHLAYTILPEIAVSGQIIMQAVRPIIDLLNSECSVNENCETLTALCNLASVNDSMRKHIFKEAGFEKIEDYMHDDNNMLKRKAAQLINNLVLCREVAVQYFEQRPYQIWHLTLFFMDKDEDTVKAMAGTVAMLTAVSKEACEQILYLNSSLKFPFSFNLLSNPNGDIQRKGIEISLNIIRNTKDMRTDIMEALRALSKDDTVQNKIKELALEAAAEWDKIRVKDESDELSQSTDNLKHVD